MGTRSCFLFIGFCRDTQDTRLRNEALYIDYAILSRAAEAEFWL
jgi:hypothetical protein